MDSSYPDMEKTAERCRKSAEVRRKSAESFGRSIEDQLAISNEQLRREPRTKPKNAKEEQTFSRVFASFAVISPKILQPSASNTFSQHLSPKHLPLLIANCSLLIDTLVSQAWRE
jgi:hypothetical protein